MIKLFMGMSLMMGVFVCADDGYHQRQAISAVDSGFEVNVTLAEAKVIEELLTTMSDSSVVSLLFKKSYLRKIAKKLRPVSSTQFLGYVFERPHLVKKMRNVYKSSLKWNNFTRSIVRGLKKEAQTSLFDDIAYFAKHTQSNKNILHQLAKEEKWNDFIVHVLEMNT